MIARILAGVCLLLINQATAQEPALVPLDLQSASTPSERTWQVVPAGLLYRSYVAGPKEPRFSSALLYDARRGRWVIDATVGARVGLLRYGTSEARGADGWQFDMEGAASPRMIGSEQLDLESTDYRFGALWTYSHGRFAWKAGYAHLSSHAGDEFLLRNSGFRRRNYVRESLVLGSRFHLSEDADMYAELAWAPVHDGGAGPLEIQFGGEFAARGRTRSGRPFAAVNVHLREETSFAPAMNLLTGWQWDGARSGSAFRIGLQFFTGPTSQVQFLGRRDTLIGIGTWFDF